ncbi:MAG: hypothetical protein IJF07_00795 [Lachnospiraceae bacterium]|nr:hypothetical protein [Lachnospiraceae bacterium]
MLYPELSEQKGKLFLRPFNYQCYKEEGRKVIHQRIGDIVLVLCIQEEIEKGFHIMRDISKKSSKANNREERQLLDIALQNSLMRMPPRLYVAEDVRFSYERQEGEFMSEEGVWEHKWHPEDLAEGRKGYRLTTTYQENGALAIFYPGVQERLAQIMGGDYYVGFVSIHEAVIHPASHKNLYEMQAAILRNSAFQTKQNILTNQIYRYSCSQKKLLQIQINAKCSEIVPAMDSSVCIMLKDVD